MSPYYNIPTDFSPRFFCPGCKAMHATKEAAVTCSKSNEKPSYTAGDILKIDVGYGWWDGKPHWLIPEGRLGPNEQHLAPGAQMYSAYFIVTSVDHEEHRVRYSVKTLGIHNGNPTGLCGWTGVNHKRGVKVNRPDLAEEAKQFIGEKYERLL